MKCFKQCESSNKSCKEKQCRLWIDYDDDLNCTMVAINKIGVSFVRIKQIEEKALNKLGITGKGLRKFLEKNESAY